MYQKERNKDRRNPDRDEPFIANMTSRIKPLAICRKLSVKCRIIGSSAVPSSRKPSDEMRRSRSSSSLSDVQSAASIVCRVSPAKALSRFHHKAERANGHEVMRQANRRSYSREIRVRTDEYSISVLMRSTHSNGNGFAFVARNCKI